MNNLKLKIAAVTLCFIGFLAVLGWAGDIDYTEQIILRMSQEEYDAVKQLLTSKDGREPSERDIAHWWADHHE